MGTDCGAFETLVPSDRDRQDVDIDVCNNEPE